MMLGMLKSLFGRRGAQASPQEAVACLNRGAILVDVREQGEFARGHVRDALNIPLGELRAGGTALLDARLPAGTHEVVLVCQSGMRSRAAQAILSGDPEAARAAMRAHLIDSQARYCAFLRRIRAGDGEAATG